MAKFTKSKEEIVAILNRGNYDELKELDKQIARDLCDNPKDSVALFVNVFCVQSQKFHRSVERISQWLFDLCKLQKEVVFVRAKSYYEEKTQKVDKADTLLSGDEDDNTIIKHARLYKFLQEAYTNYVEMLECKLGCALFNKLFESREISNEIFWKIIEHDPVGIIEYDEDELKELKRFNFHAIQNMINESKLFDEDGYLDENITFRDLRIFAESKFLWLTFNDTSLEIQYRRTMSEYYRN